MTMAARRRGFAGRAQEALRGQRQERLSVTVPRDLAEYVRASAETSMEPQSTIVADALRMHRREVRRMRTMEALEANAELDLAMAEEGIRSGAPID
jgi:hypothetical protein